MDPNERVVGKREGPSEVQCPIDDRAGKCLSSRNREPERRHDGEEQRRGEREAEAGSPQRRKLTVAEPDADAVAPREDRAGEECRERHALARGVHATESTPVPPVSLKAPRRDG